MSRSVRPIENKRDIDRRGRANSKNTGELEKQSDRLRVRSIPKSQAVEMVPIQGQNHAQTVAVSRNPLNIDNV
ncbi:MAG: hypothetical protein J7641_01280 [Cyanobacteria bacterium SID2]|nr:hypothetical protein [Cyanobacteria bacterium SID2]